MDDQKLSIDIQACENWFDRFLMSHCFDVICKSFSFTWRPHGSV